MEAPERIYVSASVLETIKTLKKVVWSDFDSESDQAYIRADLHDQEVQRLRAALESVKYTLEFDEDVEPKEASIKDAYSTACKALSPSAPAEQEVSQGEWREFVPSAYNQVQDGDEVRDDSVGWTKVSLLVGTIEALGSERYRRFHPATTNQE